MSATQMSAAFLVVGAGVMAAVHVAKLPPVLSEVGAELKISVIDAGFLLSGVQFAGMLLGVTVGALADAVGLRRCVLWGLSLLATSAIAGALATTASTLLLTRMVEGVGLLLVAMPAPGLLRQLVPARMLQTMLGFWGTYMPLGFVVALLAGPLVTLAFGWRVWWAVLALITIWVALLVQRGVGSDADRTGPSIRPVPAHLSSSVLNLARNIRTTLASKGAWLVAVMFALYSAQWLSLIGFLPSIYQAAGFSPWASGMMVAWIAIGNMAGNLASGRLLHAGVTAKSILIFGYLAMALTSIIGYAPLGLDIWARYLAFWLFSALGGLVPASLFSLALRTSPGDGAIATTVGWVQQMSSFGQFVGPPLAGGLAAWTGGWELTWTLNTGCCCLGLVACMLIQKFER